MNIDFAQQERARQQAQEQYERDMAFFNEIMNERLDTKRYMREQDELSEQFALDQNRRISEQQRALEAAARERRMFDLEQIANDKKEYEKKKGGLRWRIRARTSYCRKRTRRTARVHEQCASSLRQRNGKPRRKVPRRP